jgi:hypothetical protein
MPNVEIIPKPAIIKVPPNQQGDSGLTSVTVQPNGHGSAIGADGKEAATFTLAKDSGASNTFTFTRSGGKPVVIDVKVTKDGADNTTVAGSLNGEPFSITVSSQGKLLKGAGPANVDPRDKSVIGGLHAAFQSKSFKDIFPKPSPTHPEDTDRIKAPAGGGLHGGPGPVVTKPEFSGPGCALCYVEIIVSTVLVQPEGIAFGAAGLWFACFR